MTAAAYTEFLERKATVAPIDGFDIDPGDVHAILKPHQRKLVAWAVAGGRRAIFAAFGLGKTLIQLETVRLTVERAGGKALIVCPLGVHQEFEHDAAMVGMQIHRIRTTAEALALPDGAIAITNYEPVRDGKLDPNVFTVATLDEAAILRSFGSKTYQTFLTLFDDVDYRFVATATPSPNRFKELIHYAGFLGIMDTGQALTRFFKRDSSQAGNLTLLESQERNFWLWLASWSAWVQSPADLCDCGCHTAIGKYWRETKDGDPAALAIYERHYSARQYQDGRVRKLFVGPGEKTVLLANDGRALFAWRKFRSDDGQVGVNCSVFRNEGAELSSEMIREAMSYAWQRWPGERLYTYVDAGKVTSTNPGYCFLKAGWRKCGMTKGGHGRARQVILEADHSCECAAYVLPEIEVNWHEIPIDHLSRENVERNTGQTYLLADSAKSLSAAAAEKRATIPARVEKLMERLAGYEVSPADQAIVYCQLNDEQEAIERALAERGISCSSIDGSMPTDEAELRLAAWRARETAVLLGKPVMLGVGLNLQQANKMAFAGIDYRFYLLIQTIHRIQRFGQTRPCVADLIYAESEREIVKTLLEKWRQHEEVTTTMSDLIREHGLSRASVTDALTRSMGVDRIEVSGDGWRLVNNDCVPEVASMAEASVGLVVTSIPFSNHYEYTPAYEDLGFTESNDHFWAQMDYLTPELLRVLAPGRIYACHVKDRILFGNVTGAGIPTSSPFHAEAIQHGLKHGFDYLGMITVVTDVVRENNQTYRLGWSEQCKDATKMGVGSPEYVLLFHKPQTDRSRGYADVPVSKSKVDYTRARWQTDAHAFWRSSGDRHLTTDELARMGPEKLAKAFTAHTLEDVYDYESHVTIGEALDGRGVLPSSFMALAPGSHHPMVWHDINRMRTLNGEQSARGLAQHICPLQLDIVDRLIVRYSNEGDLVLDPFSGLGTVPLRALALDRQGIGVELNGGYFLDAVKYLEAESRKKGMPTLFDSLTDEPELAAA